jgi:hypothetical protein
VALRVPRAELPIELSESMIEQFGAVPEPLAATWHNPKRPLGRPVSRLASLVILLQSRHR